MSAVHLFSCEWMWNIRNIGLFHFLLMMWSSHTKVYSQHSALIGNFLVKDSLMKVQLMCWIFKSFNVYYVTTCSYWFFFQSERLHSDSRLVPSANKRNVCLEVITIKCMERSCVLTLVRHKRAHNFPFVSFTTIACISPSSRNVYIKLKTIAVNKKSKFSFAMRIFSIYSKLTELLRF